MSVIELASDAVLGAMITPAVLISASGTLSLATSNRLGRVVDRVRALGEEAEQLELDPKPSADAAAKHDLIARQLVFMVRRIGLLQTALTAVYIAIGLLVGTSLAVGLATALPFLPQWVAVATALGGATSLLVASVLLVMEARLAVRGTLLEMASIRGVIARKARSSHVLQAPPVDDPEPGQQR
jgi:hypothetical protein